MLRVCAQEDCPAAVRADCVKSLKAVDELLPTVVLSVTNGSGADVTNANVFVDGKLLPTSLDGRSVPMNPGPHTFHFEAPDGASADQKVVINDGERARTVAVVLIPKALPPPPAPVAQPAPVAPSPPIAPSPPGAVVVALDQHRAPTGGTGVRTAGWIAGGLGVVGLAVGAVAGGIAAGDKSSAKCSASNLCASGPLSSTWTAASVSTGGFLAGGALVVSGVALVLIAPSGRPETAVRVAPVVGQTGGGLAVGGSW